MLASALNQHEQIVVPQETDFIIPLAFIRDRVKDEQLGRKLISELVVATERFHVSLGNYLTAVEVKAAIDEAPYEVPSMVEAIYARVAKAVGRRIAGDKSPNDLVYARMLMKNGFADSSIKVVHLVRDIRDVLLSLAEAQPQNADLLNRYFARSWSQANLFLQDMYRDKSDRYHFLRYEDLVQDPVGEFSRLTAFLGVPLQEGMFDGAARLRRHEGERQHQNLGGEIRAYSVGWRTAMSAELRDQTFVQAREALERFSYPQAP